MEIEFSCETIRRIAATQVRHVRDEIERSENPAFMRRGLENLIRRFGIELAQKIVLDFGCSGGAFEPTLLWLGVPCITGVKVDEGLLAVAESRLRGFSPDDINFKKSSTSTRNTACRSRATGLTWFGRMPSWSTCIRGGGHAFCLSFGASTGPAACSS